MIGECRSGSGDTDAFEKFTAARIVTSGLLFTFPVV
jgi:hypothetical protein